MIFLTGFFLAAAVIAIHYEVLYGIANFVQKHTRPHRFDMIIVMTGVTIAHMLEAFIYAMAYWVRTEYLQLDHYAHKSPKQLFDYFYFSLETYTTIGYGDLYLVGDARFLSSSEGLLGLLLLGWSASFILLILKEKWDKDHKAAK
jgi:hypothetical protein